MIQYKDLKTDGGSLKKSCPIFEATKVGSSSCVHCRFFVDADDKGSPNYVNCYGWRNRDKLNRELIILMEEVKKDKKKYGLGR